MSFIFSRASAGFVVEMCSFAAGVLDTQWAGEIQCLVPMGLNKSSIYCPLMSLAPAVYGHSAQGLLSAQCLQDGLNVVIRSASVIYT